jgi:ActR/RegA family two-component response regulator
VIHDDDAFRKSLIATLDQRHFTVTFAVDGAEAIDILATRRFKVVLIGVDLKNRNGLASLDFLRDRREAVGCGLILLGDPDPAIRTYAPWASETLLKPVDADYVATRARTYCDC